MKAYKVEILIIDFDELGSDGIKSEIENARYSNHCISPEVIEILEADIGDWNDDHILNKKDLKKEEYRKLFN